MCRINSVESLQLWSHIAIRREEVFIPCAIAAILAIGGVITALFVTHTSLNISIPVSVVLVTAYAATMLALFLLRKAYLDRIQKENQADEEEWKNSPWGKLSEQLQQEQSQKTKNEKTQPDPNKNVQWIIDNQEKIEEFMKESMTRMFPNKKVFESLPAINYVVPPNHVSPQSPRPSEMSAPMVVYNYTLCTGKTIPFIATRMKLVFKSELERKRFSAGSDILTALYYLDFCFPKDGAPQFRWNITSIERWDAQENSAGQFPKHAMSDLTAFAALVEGKNPLLQLV